MIILYHIKCKDCGHEVTGDTECFSGTYWFCKKCKSKKLQMHLEIEPYRKEKLNVTNSTRLQETNKS